MGVDHFLRNNLLILQWKLRLLIGKQWAQRLTIILEKSIFKILRIVR